MVLSIIFRSVVISDLLNNIRSRHINRVQTFRHLKQLFRFKSTDSLLVLTGRVLAQTGDRTQQLLWIARPLVFMCKQGACRVDQQPSCIRCNTGTEQFGIALVPLLHGLQPCLR